MSPLERVRSLIGTAYRPSGRDPEIGLDCLGLVLICFGIEWRDCLGRDGRTVDQQSMSRHLASYFTEVAKAISGDLVVMRSGRRWHFAIADGDALIHADARARCVVRRRGNPPWPIVSRWRVKGK